MEYQTFVAAVLMLFWSSFDRFGLLDSTMQDPTGQRARRRGYHENPDLLLPGFIEAVDASS